MPETVNWQSRPRAPAFLLMRALAILGWIDARLELDRRDAFEHVRGLARRQAAALRD